MVDQSAWSVRNKQNEFFAKANHVRLAKNQISKLRVDLLGGVALYAVAGFTPKLVFDFETETYATGGSVSTFDDSITYTGDSLKTMVDSDGVLKWAPHNFLEYSEQFDNAVWAKNSATVAANAIAAPDLTMTAEKLTEGSDAASSHGILQDNLPSTEGGYTAAAWAKKGERYHLCLHCIVSAGRATASFDLTNGTIRAERFSGNGVKKAVTIEDAGGGWWLCKIEFSTSIGIASLELQVDDGVTALGGSGCFYDGDGASGIHIWGAHLYRSDLGGMVNNPDRGDSYVPTTDSPVYLPRRGHHVYDGTSYVNEGLLVESEARTNLVPYSEDFTDAIWQKTNTDTLAIDAIGPDGETSAVTLVDSGAGGTGVVETYIAPSGLEASKAYTFSVYLKSGGLTWASINIDGFNSTSVRGSFFLNLSTGELGTQSTTGTLVVQDIGNGWYRASLTTTLDADTTGRFRILLASSDNDLTVPFDGTSSILIYGAQLEQAPTPSSYIPTAGATVTRAAETLTVPAAKLPYSSTNMSIQIEGKASFVANNYPQWIRWERDNQSDISLRNGGAVNMDLEVDARSVGSTVAAIPFAATNNGGILQPYNFAFYNVAGGNMNIADFGTAQTAILAPSLMPDLSATDLYLAQDYMGTLRQFRLFDEDLGDAGIEEASS